VLGERAVAVNKQLEPLHPSQAVRCYDIPFVNWVYSPEESCPAVRCSDNCLYEADVAIKTVGQAQGRHFYLAHHEETDSEQIEFFSWPSTNYPYQYSNPSSLRRDVLRAQKHCDGSWSFLTQNGKYLSGASLYADNLSCAEKWIAVRSRDGNGHFLRNVWNNGWLAFNGCNWHVSYYWRTKVVI
jgi:hypothetical protein